MICIPKIPGADSVKITFDKNGNIDGILIYFKVLTSNTYEWIQKNISDFEVDAITTDNNYVVLVMTPKIVSD